MKTLFQLFAALAALFSRSAVLCNDASFQPVVDLANDRAYSNAVDLPVWGGGDRMDAGQIYLMGNDSRLSEGTFNQPLTTYAVGGWSNNMLAEEVDFLCGRPVEVPRRFNYKAWTNAEGFWSDVGVQDDVRANGADFGEVRITNTEVSAKTLNRGLIMKLDTDDLTDTARSEQARIDLLLNRLRLNQFRRAFALLSGSATNTARTWTTLTTYPDTDLLNTLAAAADVSGVKPNRICFGETAHINRITGFNTSATAGAFAAASRTPEQLAQYLGVDKILVSRSRYQSSASAKTRVIGNKVLSFYATDSAVPEDPSNIKRFYSPTDSGGPIRVLRWQPNPKTIIIGVEHYELISITYSSGIRQETVS